MLPLPPGNEESRDLADWLELNALVGRAKQVSLDDLRDGLRTGAIGFNAQQLPPEQANLLEEIAGDVRTELESRSRWAREAYPFRLRGSSLERTISSESCLSSTYVFCLMLSVLPWDTQRFTGYFPDRIFEEVSCLVAEKYINGKAVRFGWPRVKSVLPSKFEKAISKLCMRMGEGAEYRADLATGYEQDAGLDVAGQSHLNLLVGSGVFSLCKGLKSPH